jgi:uncharacterized protein
VKIIYSIQGSEFEWDTYKAQGNKAQGNIEKHGVTFEEAAQVFLDPFYQSGDASVNNEQREFVIGYSLMQRLLLVVYVDRSKDRSRIISARSVTRNERKLYDTPCVSSK